MGSVSASWSAEAYQKRVQKRMGDSSRAALNFMEFLRRLGDSLCIGQTQEVKACDSRFQDPRFDPYRSADDTGVLLSFSERVFYP